MEVISAGVMGVMIVPILILLFILAFVANQYKRCPSNRILVIYGKVAGEQSAKCIHGGGSFVIPLIQDYKYLPLDPMTTEIDLKGALSKNNIRVNAPSTFTIGISTDPVLMSNAAERLLGLNIVDIINQANDIILGQLRLVIATLTIEEINGDREKFLEQINKNVNTELNKVGLEVINVNIRDITDESGYINAIGQRAAAEAINKAKVDVAQQERSGAIGEAEANKEKEVKVAQQLSEADIGKTDAERERRVEVSALEAKAEVGEAEANKEKEVQVAQQLSEAAIGKTNADKIRRVEVSAFEAEAVEGENEAKAKIAKYNAELAEKEAESKRIGEVAKANAERDVLKAQKEQEAAKLEKEEVVKQEIEKTKVQIQADAEAERQRRIALGEADAIRVKYLAEAEGIRAVLESKAMGYERLVGICGERPEIATSFLMIEKIDELVEKQVEAIKNIKFDKITVWDGGSGSANGSTTANFMRDLMKSLPAMHDLAAQAGVQLPEYLGSVASESQNGIEQHQAQTCTMEPPDKEVNK